jgi:hypothetical protein
MTPTPSASATRRIDSASSPSASAIAMAAATMRSTVMPGFRPRVGAGLVPQSRAIVAAMFSVVIDLDRTVVPFMRTLYPL